MFKILKTITIWNLKKRISVFGMKKKRNNWVITFYLFFGERGFSKSNSLEGRSEPVAVVGNWTVFDLLTWVNVISAIPRVWVAGANFS